MLDALELFSPPTRAWFTENFSAPTPPQAQGWLPIQRGEHTLILAPTGSGKTLAAFLWGINQIYFGFRNSDFGFDSPQSPVSNFQPPISNLQSLTSNLSISQSLHLLYISPLKALNNDIERNLRAPLAGIRALAARTGNDLPELRVAVRTGDTPARERAAMLKKPPHILITTPESLYLMLTSPRAREIFRGVRTVIVDEIHTLVGNKRGAHLALSLERLTTLSAERVQRIGLSATIQPLEEAARWLGGQTQSPVISQQWSVNSETLAPHASAGVRDPKSEIPRPVTIVNAAYKKNLDLRVVTVAADFANLPATSIWPLVVPNVLNEIRRHKTTLIFANNRRLAERTADRLNAQIAAEETEEIEPGSPEALALGGIARDRGMFAIGAAGPIRAHHGSMSKDARRKMEEDLKAGKLPALVGTSSLELGIDIGAIDLVVQLQSPKSVAQGLQRVGRSGHLVGQTSVGRIYATFREDLVEAAAIARGMLEGDVEPTRAPENPLDVLAQQIVAMVACEDWDAGALYDVVRRAYPYRDFSRAAFDAVIEMLAGKYQFVVAHGSAPLRAKISFDRVNQRLRALPGSRLAAIANAGTIPDTGAYAVYLADNKTKLGELDEEFIFETRPGDTFLLGSHVWRALEIKDDRIIVGEAAGATPRMPFWRGDYPYRPYELGARIGKFRREIAERAGRDVPAARLYDWLQNEYALDENSARNLIAHVQKQLDAVGVLSSDQTIVVESFQDAVGDPRMVIHCPFGGRVNGAWALALTSALQEKFGIAVEAQTNDDGILFRFPPTFTASPAEIIQQMSAAEARARILRQLPDSALFGARFRMNAARALLLPRAVGKKRTPFWLQRLKAKDLLAIVRTLDDFPIVAETYRECLRDALDLPHLEELLEKIQRGETRVAPIETLVPSPIAASLLNQFASVYMYEWDAPKAERQLQTIASRDLVNDLLGDARSREILKPAAIQEVVARAQHTAEGYKARSAEELALILQELGDLSLEEIIARSAGDARAWLAQLAAEKRAVEVEIAGEKRWIPVLLFPQQAVEQRSAGAEERLEVLRRFLRSSGPVTRAEILNRYAFDEQWLDAELARLIASREIVNGIFAETIRPTDPPTTRPSDQYCARHLLEQFHQRTLTLLRKEIQPVSLFAYADFLARWQHVHPREQFAGVDATRRALEQLRGVALPEILWTRDVLPARVADFDARELDALCASGELVWVAQNSRVRFFFRGEGALFLNPPDESALGADARRVYDFLKAEGASFVADIQAGVGLKRDAVQNALAELAQAGCVTNDSFDALRVIFGGATTRVAPTQTENDLAARLQTPRALTRTRYRDAKRRVAQRLRAETPRAVWRGRWALVQRAGILGAALADDERAEKIARVLLARYGVLTRDSLEREEIAADWAALYAVLQRWEMRGEIRRGYFVAGLAGAQFALPDAVEQLRATPFDSASLRSGYATPTDDAFVVLNAADPAQIFGGEVPDVAARFARVPSTFVVLQRGAPVLIAEENGERITTTPDLRPPDIGRALQAFLARPNASPRWVVKEWNGENILGSAGEEILQTLGLHRAPMRMEK